MEALQFLGGKYNELEQISTGPVQTYRGRNAGTGVPVYVHRVSTLDEPVAQANLLKLMTAALVRSGEVKRLVLDFGDEQGFLYVVTESDPRCRSLREWLHMELNGSSPISSQAPASTDTTIAAMGEFARLFQPLALVGPAPTAAASSSSPQAPPTQNVEPLAPVISLPPPNPPANFVPTGTPSPGEFNRIFAESEAEAQRFANLHSAPTAAPLNESEPVADVPPPQEKPVMRVFQARSVQDAPVTDPPPRRQPGSVAPSALPRVRSAHASVEQPVIRPGPRPPAASSPAPATIPIPAFAAAKPASNNSLWILVAIVVVLAILVVVYLLFYR